MYAFLLLLAIWPFTSSTGPGPGHAHSRAYHARHLRHIQQARAERLSRHHHAAHPSLIRTR